MGVNERGVRLRAFCEAVRDLEVTTGIDDCCPWVAAWIEQERGITPALPPYGSRAKATHLILQAGGLLPMVETALAPCNLSRTGDPQLGDVGVLRLSDRDVAAIFCHGGIAAIRGERTGYFLLAPENILAAWSI